MRNVARLGGSGALWISDMEHVHLRYARRMGGRQCCDVILAPLGSHSSPMPDCSV